SPVIWLEDRAVVRADLLAPAVRVRRLVELRRVLDLILLQAEVDLLVGDVEPRDRLCRDHDLSAEDPWAGVDDDVGGADVIRRLVDLADVAVERDGVEAVQGLRT